MPFRLNSDMTIVLLLKSVAQSVKIHWRIMNLDNVSSHLRWFGSGDDGQLAESLAHIGDPPSGLRAAATLTQGPQIYRSAALLVPNAMLSPGAASPGPVSHFNAVSPSQPYLFDSNSQRQSSLLIIIARPHLACPRHLFRRASSRQIQRVYFICRGTLMLQNLSSTYGFKATSGRPESK